MFMSLDEAHHLVGNQSSHSLKNMIRALSLHPWLNTIDDLKRLKAAKLILSSQRPRPSSYPRRLHP